MPWTAASGDDTRVGSTVPSTPVDLSKGTKAIPLQKTVPVGSSKQGGATQGEKGAGVGRALIVRPLPKLIAPRKLSMKRASADVILGSVGSTSAAPKPSNEDPAGVTDVDARAAEEMADYTLRDSPIPETEEERKQAEDIPTGPHNQEDPRGEVGDTPHVEASLVVG